MEGPSDRTVTVGYRDLSPGRGSRDRGSEVHLPETDNFDSTTGTNRDLTEVPIKGEENFSSRTSVRLLRYWDRTVSGFQDVGRK